MPWNATDRMSELGHTGFGVQNVVVISSN
jgi:hypothetical protein